MSQLRVPARAALAAAAVVLVLACLAGTRSLENGRATPRASACPPGYVSGAQLRGAASRERRAEVAGLRARGRDAERPLGDRACRARNAPETAADLLTVQADATRRATGGQAVPRAGAYASAARQARRLAAAPATVPGAGGAWQPVGTTPLVADDQRFTEVSGEGLADLNGRISDFAYDGHSLYAAVGEGGVWRSDDLGGHWQSIGDGLPTQAVGGIAWSPAAGGTLVIATGDSVFGGGGTFAGMGAFYSTDGGASWHRSTGVPAGVIAFKVAADPNDASRFYAATGAGLYRSTDGGQSFANVDLPTGRCAGQPADAPPCALANMVTDVVVQGPDNAATDGTPGAVLAAVGWRTGRTKASVYDGRPESPGNGLYRSDTGDPGTFAKAGELPKTFPAVPGADLNPGRIELGAATGPAQDHRYVYALAEDADKFNGTGPDQLDVPGQKIPFPTTFGGVYVSADFGRTWTLMESAEEMQDPSSGSALVGTACAMQYCPGVQSWYNQWIKPDPTGAGPVPTRLVFGLEEVWAAAGSPQNTHEKFDVVGPYFSGSTCLFLNVDIPCPTTHSDPTRYNTTTHPDQHTGIWVPTSDGVTLVVANDGGAYKQALTGAGAPSPDAWGRGANLGFHTLLPYDAQVAKDGTIYAGLQDNGELKVQPDGKQFETFGGDGTFSAVDPDNSDIAYEATPNNAMAKTTDGGKSWNALTVPDDTYQFANPFEMDPIDASHLLTAGNGVHESTDGGENWTTVFDLGPAPSGAENVVSALDVRGVGTALPAGGRATPDFDFDGGTGTVPGAAGQTAGVDAPGTYVDRPFTIAAGEADKSATIDVTWPDGTNDWDLVVFRSEGGTLTEVGSSAGGPPSHEERVVLARPPAGDYVIRVRNYAATGTFTGTARFAAAEAGDVTAAGSAAYVAFCGYCDALNTKPFHNGLATNVGPDATIGKPARPANWRFARAQGLPQRYITSVQMDPADPKVVYVTLAGYSRRWLRPGAVGGADEGATLAGFGHVYKSTDAGDTFTDVSQGLPDAPADFSIVHNGNLIVATDVGVFTSSGTDGGAYEALGDGLPAVPVFSLELKPKKTATEGDVLVVATQGRGVYCYAFTAAEKAPACTDTLKQSGAAATPAAPATAGTSAPAVKSASPVACTASRELTRASATRAGRGLRVAFTRRTARPVTVDVFRVSRGRHVLAESRVAHFTNRSKGFTWNGRGVGDGFYFVRFRLLSDTQRLVLRRAHGRWSRRPDYYGRLSCSTVRQFKLLRPVFGGTRATALGISAQLTVPARLAVTVRRAGKVVKRYAAQQVPAGKVQRHTLPARGLKRGDYRVTLDVRRGSEHIVRTLTSRRL